MIVRDLRVYADALEGDVYHYRDKSGLECDAVICLHDGRYALVEVKLGGPELIADGLSTLEKVAARIDQARMGAPAFCMVLTGANSLCFTARNGIHVVPVDRLAP